MKFGLFYLFSDFGNISQDQVFHEVLEEIEYAEELGFDSVWLPEHHFAIYGMLGNPMVLAAAIARCTRRMQIGTAIMVLPFQHPLRLAEDAALVAAARGAGLRVAAWTVNEEADIRRVLGLGVDVVISDQPDLALRLAGRGPKP